MSNKAMVAIMNFSCACICTALVLVAFVSGVSFIAGLISR